MLGSDMQSRYRYRVYGINLSSDTPLALPASENPSPETIFLSRGIPTDSFPAGPLESRREWYHVGAIASGGYFVRWDELGEFAVSSDGSSIAWEAATGATSESIQTYLLGHALSYALVQRGHEPLHGTAIVADGEVLVFLGDSGYGKSTLAGSFVAAGHALLTDDLLLLSDGPGGWLAQPGPSRIKLFPVMASQVLGEDGGEKMNPITDKRILPLAGERVSASAAPVRAIYVLAHPEQGEGLKDVELTPLSGRDAFLAIVTNTFNTVIANSERLRRQATLAARLVHSVPIFQLSYERTLSALERVRETLMADVSAAKR